MRKALLLWITLIPFALFADSQLPAVSPDGKRIAYVSEKDLFVVDADGTNAVRLTNTPEQETPPVWSSDGKRVLFAVAEKESSTIYSVGLDGAASEIGKVPGRVVTISPDAKRVLYALGTWTEVRLMEAKIDGSDPHQLTDGSSVVWAPRWSPDRKRIAFTGRDNDKTLHIYVMNSDGSHLRDVAHADSADGQMQMPAWSPDGRRLAVQVSAKGTSHIWIVEAKKGTARKLAAHSEMWLDEAPAWFPDGKRIAFQSNRTGEMEVWTMRTDGSDLRRVTGTNPR
jgi:TolB protein